MEHWIFAPILCLHTQQLSSHLSLRSSMPQTGSMRVKSWVEISGIHLGGQAEVKVIWVLVRVALQSP